MAFEELFTIASNPETEELLTVAKRGLIYPLEVEQKDNILTDHLSNPDNLHYESYIIQDIDGRDAYEIALALEGPYVTEADINGVEQNYFQPQEVENKYRLNSFVVSKILKTGTQKLLDGEETVVLKSKTIQLDEDSYREVERLIHEKTIHNHQNAVLGFHHVSDQAKVCLKKDFNFDNPKFEPWNPAIYYNRNNSKDFDTVEEARNVILQSSADIATREEAKEIAKAIVGLNSYSLERLMEIFSRELLAVSYASEGLHDAVLHSMEKLHQHDINGQLNPAYIKLLDEEYMPIIEKAEEAAAAQQEFEELDYAYDQTPDSEEKGIEFRQAKKLAERLYEEFYDGLDEVVEATKAINEQLEKNSKTLFLLGGHDLEMEEIKKMLDEHGIPYLDKNLSWGAKLEDYDDSLEEMLAADKIYGIELSGNIEDLTSRLEDYLDELDQEKDNIEYEIDFMPGGDNDENWSEYEAIKKEISLTSELATKLDNGSLPYDIIDHHNEFSGFKSSIEQVADILGVQLNRHQQLVAANDSRHIEGMKEMGATDEEIAEIRRLDRVAQGVTEADEKMAEDAIAKKIDAQFFSEDGIGRLTIVRVPDDMSKFSPITDALHGTENLIIYNSHEFCYYGPQAHRLGKEVMPKEVSQGKAYFGGAETSGFFGTSYDAIPKMQAAEKLFPAIMNAIVGIREVYGWKYEKAYRDDEGKRHAAKDCIGKVIWDEGFYREFSDLLDFGPMGLSDHHGPYLSEAFIRDFEDRFDWNELSYADKAEVPYDLLVKHADEANWGEIIGRRRYVFTPEFASLAAAHTISVFRMEDMPEEYVRQNIEFLEKQEGESNGWDELLSRRDFKNLSREFLIEHIDKFKPDSLFSGFAFAIVPFRFTPEFIAELEKRIPGQLVYEGLNKNYDDLCAYSNSKEWKTVRKAMDRMEGLTSEKRHCYPKDGKSFDARLVKKHGNRRLDFHTQERYTYLNDKEVQIERINYYNLSEQHIFRPYGFLNIETGTFTPAVDNKNDEAYHVAETLLADASKMLNKYEGRESKRQVEIAWKDQATGLIHFIYSSDSSAYHKHFAVSEDKKELYLQHTNGDSYVFVFNLEKGTYERTDHGPSPVEKKEDKGTITKIDLSSLGIGPEADSTTMSEASNTLVQSALDTLDSTSKKGRALIGDVSESGDFKYIVTVDGESMERKGRLEGDTVLLYPSNSDEPVISIKDGVITNLTEKEQGKGIKR